MTDDVALLDAWCSGDSRAADRLFHRHFSTIARFFRNKLGPRTEDLVQQTFLRLIEGRARFRRGSSYRTYLYATAHNVLREELRRRSRAAGRHGDQPLASLRDPGPDPAEALASMRARQHVQAALRRLALEPRVVLELYHYEELTGPELAKILALPEPAVRSRLRRATAQLRCALEETARTPEDAEPSYTRCDTTAVMSRIASAGGSKRHAESLPQRRSSGAA